MFVGLSASGTIPITFVRTCPFLIKIQTHTESKIQETQIRNPIFALSEPFPELPFLAIVSRPPLLDSPTWLPPTSPVWEGRVLGTILNLLPAPLLMRLRCVSLKSIVLQCRTGSRFGINSEILLNPENPGEPPVRGPFGGRVVLRRSKVLLSAVLPPASEGDPRRFTSGLWSLPIPNFVRRTVFPSRAVAGEGGGDRWSAAGRGAISITSQFPPLPSPAACPRGGTPSCSWGTAAVRRTASGCTPSGGSPTPRPADPVRPWRHPGRHHDPIPRRNFPRILHTCWNISNTLFLMDTKKIARRTKIMRFSGPLFHPERVRICMDPRGIHFVYFLGSIQIQLDAKPRFAPDPKLSGNPHTHTPTPPRLMHNERFNSK